VKSACARTISWAVCAAVLLGCSGGEEVATPGSIPSETMSTVRGMEEWIVGVVECLHDSGWPSAELNSTGDGINVRDLTAEQRGDFRGAHDLCVELAGDAPNSAPLGEDEVRQLYAHLVAMVTCIEELGYEVRSTPPSESVFVQTYLSGEPPWSPYVDLDASMNPSDWDELNRRCPQAPWK